MQSLAPQVKIRALTQPDAFEFRPRWDERVSGYAANFINKNLWRIKATHDFEDAMQEAWIVFDTVRKTYAGRIDNAAWFMGLYKVSLAGHMHDLATKATKERQAIVMSDLGTPTDPFNVESLVGELANLGELLVHIKQAPEEVLAVLNLFFNAPTDLLELITSSWREKGHNNALVSSRRIGRMLGLPEDIDCLEATRQYFSH